METCRKAPERREALRAEAAEPRSENMAEVILKNIKKVYPNSEPKKKSKDSGEKKHNLQITDEGVVAVQEFNLDIADTRVHRPRRPLRLRQIHDPAHDRGSGGDLRG